LREDKRQNEQRRQYGPGKFHASRCPTIRTPNYYHS
jgi:hypothetical protein